MITQLRNRAVAALIYALVNYRTFMLETFLAVEALACGLWILWPGGEVFTAGTALSPVPKPLIGALLAAHGLLALRVLHRRDMVWCQRSALISFGLWIFVAATYAVTPPHLLFALPLTACQAAGALWCYARLSIRAMP